MDGLAALKAIRQLQPNANIVMVSAVNQKEKLRECIESGAIDFVVKPFNPANLKAFFEQYRQSD